MNTTLLVGMKLSAECRERLTWIIAKLTHPGDHVVAVHVVQSTARSPVQLHPEKELDAATRRELDLTFQGVLGVYQSLCNLKQIKFDIKVVVGASVREALLDAAKVEKATKLILGTSTFLPTGFATSLAKFCLKRLSASCSVTVISRGKVIFDKEGTLKHPELGAESWTPAASLEDMNKSSESTAADTGYPSPSSSFVSETTLSESDKSFPDSPVSVLHPNSDASKNNKPGFPSFSLNALNRASRSLSYPQQRASTSSDETQSQVAASTSSSSGDENGSTSPKHGWPLRAFPLEKTSRTVGRKLSVVNWAMQLPNRSSRDGKLHSTPHGRASVSTCSSQYDGSTSPLQDKPKNKNLHVRRRSLQEWCSFDGRQTNAQDLSDAVVTTKTHEAMAMAKEETSAVCEPSVSERLQLLCSRDVVSSRKFTLDELETATCSFSESNLIGTGGCSKVYRGVLLDGQHVAVKCLNQVTPSTEQELITEVEVLSTLRHTHIVTLIGYCVEEQRRMLVYNLAQNGNLEQILHGANSSGSVLDWAARQKIAVGASEALDYLHDGCPRAVLHRDVKSSNILLSGNFEPQVSDFGLAIWAPASGSALHIRCTDVAGTFGYLAPEYFMFGKVNEKTDVYSFGVVLLELITGRHPIDVSRPKGQENLVIWGRPLLEAQDMDLLVDPRLEERYDKSQMLHMILAAALCLRQSPELRPGMRKISELLNGGNEKLLAAWASRELKKFREQDEDYFKDEIYATSSSDVSVHLALAMVGVDDFTSCFGQQDC